MTDLFRRFVVVLEELRTLKEEVKFLHFIEENMNKEELYSWRRLYEESIKDD